MSGRIKLFKTTFLTFMFIFILLGVIAPFKAFAVSDEIELKPSLDTMPEKKVDKYAINFSGDSVNIPRPLAGDADIAGWLKTNIDKSRIVITSRAVSIWDSLPDRVRGLIKGAGGGAIAAVIILLIVLTGVISLPAALIGAFMAVVTGLLYGLYVGGDHYNWVLGILFPLLAGLSAAIFAENFGLLALRGIRPIAYLANKFSWLKTSVRPFIIGGLVNLTGYLSSHHYSQYTWWGIIGSFIIGGITGTLYGEFLIWLKEARYITLFTKYSRFAPLSAFAGSKLGRFVIYNVIGGGLMGALTTLAQNSFIGERTTASGLLAGALSGFMASLLIRATYMGLTRSVAKKVIKDLLDSSLSDFVKLKIQNQIDKLTYNKKQSGTGENS